MNGNNPGSFYVKINTNYQQLMDLKEADWSAQQSQDTLFA